MFTSPHSSLNSRNSQGIVRDRDQDIIDLTEEEICSELKSQGVTKVKRFMTKKSGNILKLNAYLLTFNSKSIPSHMYIASKRLMWIYIYQSLSAVWIVKSLVSATDSVKISEFAFRQAVRVLMVSAAAAQQIFAAAVAITWPPSVRDCQYKS